jgi:hypothetical protein
MGDMPFLRFKNLLDLIKDFFSKKIQKHLCNALGFHDMHVSLPTLKYSLPSLMLHHHRVSLFAIQKPSQFFLIHQAIRVYCILVLYSNANAVPIPGCPQWLLLSLFIKPNHAPKVWCCLVHHKWVWNNHSAYLILSRIVIWLAMCILPTIIINVF